MTLMESKASSYSENGPKEASNYDEIFMQHSLLFTNSLKDLKNLGKQLYSAAEYFELSCHKDDHNQLVLETLKDYATKALISTVDHLGSIAYKVDNFLDEKVHEVSGTMLRISCVEQRMRTCQEFVDCGGLLQQSLVIRTPKYHKQYVIPVGENLNAISKGKPIYGSCSFCPEGDFHLPNKDLEATAVKPHSSLFRKGHSRLLSSESSPSPLTFSFSRVASKKEPGKRAVSPLGFPFNRSGSVANRSITPSSFNDRKWYPPAPQRSVSLCIRPERDRTKEIERYTKKSKHLLRAMLSMHKWRKDG